MEYFEIQEISEIEGYEGKSWANHHTVTPHPIPTEAVINDFCAQESTSYFRVFIFSP